MELNSLHYYNKIDCGPLVLECPGPLPSSCPPGTLRVARRKLLDRLVDPEASVEVAVAKVVFGLEQKVLDVVARRLPALEEVVGALNLLNFIHQVLHYSPAPLWESLGHLESLLGRRVDHLTVDVRGLFVVRILVPLRLDLLEAPEVHWSAAHGAGRLGTLAVPGLDARIAEGVAAEQLAEAPGLTVAD